MSTDVEIVPATFEDVKPFFGGLPPYRLKAFAGRLGDETIGVGGIYFLPDGTKAAFLILTEEAKKRPVTVYKTAKKFMDKLTSEGVRRVVAVADPAVESAVRFLEHFNFKPIPTRNEQVIYEWRVPTQ